MSLAAVVGAATAHVVAAVKKPRTREQIVTAAVLRCLGYDADTHDLVHVRGPFRGVRVVGPDGPVKFLRQRTFDAVTRGPIFAVAMQTFLEHEAAK